MQQVECFLNGTFDYEQIYGNTGPIVYPAGHLYLYTLLYYVTNRGTNIYLAQNIFAFLYLATLWIVFRLYSSHSKVRTGSRYFLIWDPFPTFISWSVDSILHHSSSTGAPICDSLHGLHLLSRTFYLRSAPF